MKEVVAIVFSLTCVLLVCMGYSAKQESLLLKIPGQGKILGGRGYTHWTNQTFYKFLGIPYAEPPSGALRFKAPVQRTPWVHTHDATKYGRRCPVITSIYQLLEDQQNGYDVEDCLSLCVYTRSLRANQSVMFYVYGGGFYNGSSEDHKPNYLLENENVVLVVPQYRVGALGWFTTRSQEMPGNAPLADILLALRWVQQNIHIFGGNPKEVTIVGQSAGAAEVGALLVSPRTAENRPFHRAIIQSGSILASWALNDEVSQQVIRACKKLNCNDCDNEQNKQKCLQEANALELLEATREDNFGMVVGDLLQILPEHPNVLLSKLNDDIPVMLGFTKHDGSFALATFYDALKGKYGSQLSSLSVQNFAEGLMELGKDTTGLSNNLLLRLLFDRTPQLLASNDHKRAIPAYIEICNIIYMKSPVITLAKRLSKKMSSTYVYSFDYIGEHTRFGYEFGNSQYPFEGGSHHSNDNLYLFPMYELNSADTIMAQQMTKIWTSFVIKGEPQTLSADFTIHPFTSESGEFFHINSNFTIGRDVLCELTSTIDDPERDQLVRDNVPF